MEALAVLLCLAMVFAIVRSTDPGPRGGCNVNPPNPDPTRRPPRPGGSAPKQATLGASERERLNSIVRHLRDAPPGRN